MMGTQSPASNGLEPVCLTYEREIKDEQWGAQHESHRSECAPRCDFAERLVSWHFAKLNTRYCGAKIRTRTRLAHARWESGRTKVASAWVKAASMHWHDYYLPGMQCGQGEQWENWSTNRVVRRDYEIWRSYTTSNWGQLFHFVWGERVDPEREIFTNFRRKLVLLQQDLEDISQDTHRSHIRTLSNFIKIIIESQSSLAILLRHHTEGTGQGNKVHWEIYILLISNFYWK